MTTNLEFFGTLHLGGWIYARGVQVYVWDVDTPDDVRYVRGLGVDTIITDHPREVIEQLDASV